MSIQSPAPTLFNHQGRYGSPGPMDWVNRLLGGTPTPSKPPPRFSSNDPQIRLARFKRVYHTILQLCNRPRSLTNEGPLLEQLGSCLDKVVAILREETRAPIPHLSLQFAAANQIYTVCARTATVSQYEPVIRSTVGIFAALVDSEEEDFLSNANFAKSLMRLARKVLEGGAVVASIDTETTILELLFTISAKIRLQPEILPFWFHSTAKPALEDTFIQEKKSFIGITQKDDFPLCYLLIDRVHHEGRIGDFARTGLLYIFEATGRSLDLEEWVVSSDLPTLMASGLGALYSQLSRELSILHPDAILPAVLAMSDYSTTQPRATAESAFSERHTSHMATFLTYLAFWQDILDHCRSADVKQTLLDHFQILFLQQLLYPSLLQSSDTDAGSSVAVLTYLTATLEHLEYPELMDIMLAYLLALDNEFAVSGHLPSSPEKTSRSPTIVRRRQSLMLLTAPKNPDDAVEPSLFNLVDLILSNVRSRNNQAVFSALKLATTLLNRQKQFAFGTLLRVQSTKDGPERTLGSLENDLEKYRDLAFSLHDHPGLEDSYAGFVHDVRVVVEAQVPALDAADEGGAEVGRYVLPVEDHFLSASQKLLRTFFTNSVDVNLALTQAIVAVALCVEIRLDNWLALPTEHHDTSHQDELALKPWQQYLDDDEKAALFALQAAARRPKWDKKAAPAVYTILLSLSTELDSVRAIVPDLDHLIMGRKVMLQVTPADAPQLSIEIEHQIGSPARSGKLEIPQQSQAHRRSSSQSSLARGRKKADNVGSPRPFSPTTSPVRRDDGDDTVGSPIAALTPQSFFLPPPPEAPSTTDVLMKQITFLAVVEQDISPLTAHNTDERKATLNHVLTNAVILQEFVLELIAVLQIRAAVLGEKEIKIS